MIFVYWLVVTSLLFVVLERVWPWRVRQRALRPGLRRDVAFLALNGHVFGVVSAGVSAWLALHATRVLRDFGLTLDGSPVSTWPLVAQVAVFFVVSDLLQWCIHNLLHRVPWLWQFHKVHHSITTMDWIGNWRFHWMEIVVYRSLQWLPLAWLGASGDAVFIVALIGTAWGDFNHANLDVGLGPLGYVFNTPRMHLWHHDVSDEGGVAKNYGVVLSLWDFVFGTAYWPRERSPERVGYAGDAEMPASLLGQLVWPLARARTASGG